MKKLEIVEMQNVEGGFWGCALSIAGWGLAIAGAATSGGALVPGIIAAATYVGSVLSVYDSCA